MGRIKSFISTKPKILYKFVMKIFPFILPFKKEKSWLWTNITLSLYLLFIYYNKLIFIIYKVSPPFYFWTRNLLLWCHPFITYSHDSFWFYFFLSFFLISLIAKILNSLNLKKKKNSPAKIILSKFSILILFCFWTRQSLLPKIIINTKLYLSFPLIKVSSKPIEIGIRKIIYSI